VTNRAVATQLHLSLHTVKTHVRNAFAKLGINSRAELTRFVRRASLTRPSAPAPLSSTPTPR
jgi:DNA-binding NarL/FixJ family response regulator